MEKHILDTNLFFNMEKGLDLGTKTKEVVIKITHLGKRLKKEKKIEFFMPPSAVGEFLSFFEDKNQSFIKDFLSILTIQAPDYGRLTLPATTFYQLIDEVRLRSFRGLNIGEEAIKKAAQIMMGEEKLDKKNFEIKIGDVIRKFREKYRQATREGFLDSVTDLDLIILTKENNGFLISTDEGVLRWGRALGIKELPVVVWKRRLVECLGVLPHREEDCKTNQKACR